MVHESQPKDKNKIEDLQRMRRGFVGLAKFKNSDFLTNKGFNQSMKNPRLVAIVFCFASLAFHATAQEQESSDLSAKESPHKKREFHEKGDFKPHPPGDREEGEMNHEGPPIPPEIIEKFDADKDGKLSREEMKEARESMRQMHKEELLKKFDKNGDGKLSDSEMEKLQQARENERKQEIIKEYDVNGNGKLDSAEKKKLLEDAKLEPRRFEWLNRPGRHPLKELLK